jgi:hypothetical protein
MDELLAIVESSRACSGRRQTVAAANELLMAARETIEVAERACAADERDRKVHQLRGPLGK